MERNKKNNGQLISVISAAAFLAIWETADRFGIIPGSLLGSPYKILHKMADSFSDLSIFPHLEASLGVLAAGFFSAAAAGVIGGIFLSSNEKAFFALRPFIFSLSSLPVVALLPLLIIWFGFGASSKVAIVFLMSVMPVLINTYDGARETDNELIKMAQSFGAGRLAILKSVVFPSALPFIFSGLRIAIGRSIIGLVVAELFGYGEGLGHLLNFYGTTGNVTGIMMTVSILLILNLSMIYILSILEKRVIKK